jgi:hypothetical protein
MLIRIWISLKSIPWWAWLFHGAGALVIAILSYFSEALPR